MKRKGLILSLLVIIFVVFLGVIIVNFNKDKKNTDNVVIYGEIESIESNDYLILNSDNGEVMEVYYDNCNQFIAGQKVKIIYDGSILTSIPPKIYAISIAEVEEFKISYALDDERLINFAYDPKYNETTISEAILKGILTFENFIDDLEYLDGLKDGGSKIYKYDSKINDGYGNIDFYVIECNSLDGIKDIYVAKYKDSLMDKCTIEVN